MELKARRGIVPMRRRPDAAAEMVTELLYGEGFRAEHDEGNWLFGMCSHDGYQGWCEANRLAPGPPPSHRVTALRAFVYPEPDFKWPPLRAISFSGLVTVVGERGAFVEIDGGGWIASVTLALIETRAPDWTGTALRFLGVPYLWGGRSSLGLDCSGLVQLSLAAAGISAPRDSGDQSREVGRPIDPVSGLQRGDLVFLPGHVALMINAVDCINASSDPMQVVEEPLEQLAARLENREGRGVTGARRIDQ